ncbi:hypothetical protein QPM17_22350 [Marinobacter sp. TBZ242]|uniref:Uncharacterized protein n=1 Tax=Marinobacter azerbaijanicus TaxID=3050455 RepID=A0ABT7IJF2_9GAMM|nr:hypothetical protein [Marinobacter sp. TBZ242]MDL0433887.1 hypothetical protein [Marinobacter sp. TBZ242]
MIAEVTGVEIIGFTCEEKVTCVKENITSYLIMVRCISILGRALFAQFYLSGGSDIMNIYIDTLVAGMNRISDFFYKCYLSKLVLDIQVDSTEAYRKIIQDADFKLEAYFEREVARQLNNGGRWGLIPAETLMPVMMSRFGGAKSDFLNTELSQLKALEEACNNCPEVSVCWRSMRSEVSAEEARNFCPSAETFVRLGKVAQ